MATWNSFEGAIGGEVVLREDDVPQELLVESRGVVGRVVVAGEVARSAALVDSESVAAPSAAARRRRRRRNEEVASLRKSNPYRR